jgi:hypothetical protein
MVEEKFLGSVHPSIEVDRPDQRFKEIGHNRFPTPAVVQPLTFAEKDVLRDVQPARELGAASGFYDMGPQLGEIPLGLEGKTGVENQSESSVPRQNLEEFQPLIVLLH